MILNDIKQLVQNDEAVDKNQLNLIYFNNFKDYFLELYIRIYLFNSNLESFFEKKQNFLIKISEIIQKNGAEIPFPITTVNLEK